MGSLYHLINQKIYFLMLQCKTMIKKIAISFYDSKISSIFQYVIKIPPDWYDFCFYVKETSD